jgi:hypothetical protein
MSGIPGRSDHIASMELILVSVLVVALTVFVLQNAASGRIRFLYWKFKPRVRR